MQDDVPRRRTSRDNLNIPRPGGATAVVVAGMHRSGTSALTRVLSVLGLDLPKRVYEARPDNPLGYWEPREVIAAHDAFLTAIGSRFDDVFPLPDGIFQTQAARDLEDRLLEVLSADFGGSRGFVVKDPRICRLIPVWISALDRFGADARFVIPVRNPLEVAASLKERNGYSATKSLLLWLRHVLEAELNTRSSPRSFLTYQALLRDWRTTMDRIGEELDITWPRASHLAYSEIEEFLSPRRRHYSFEQVELEARRDVAGWVKQVYDAMATVAAGGPLQRDVFDTVREELARADLVFAPLLADATLAVAGRNEQLSQKQQEIERVSADLVAAQADAAERAMLLSSLESDLATARARVEALVTELESARTMSVEHQQGAEQARILLEQQISEAQARLGVAEAAVVELEVQRVAVAQFEVDLGVARGDADVVRVQLAEAQARLGVAEAAVVELEVQRVAVAQFEVDLGVARGDADVVRVQLAEAQARLGVAEAAVVELEVQRVAVAQFEVDLGVARGDADVVRVQLAEAQARLGVAEAAVVELEVQRVAVAQLEVDLGVARGDADVVRVQLAEAQARLGVAEAAVVELEVQRAAVAQLEVDLGVARGDADVVRVQLAEAQARLGVAEAAVVELEVQRVAVAQLEVDLGVARGDADVVRVQLAEAQARLGVAEAAVVELEVQRVAVAQLEADLGVARGDADGVRVQLAEAQARLGVAEAAVVELEVQRVAVAQLEAGAAVLRERLGVAEAAVVELELQRAAVAQLESALATSREDAEAVRRRLEAHVAAADEAAATAERRNRRLESELSSAASHARAQASEIQRLYRSEHELSQAVDERELQITRISSELADVERTRAELALDVARLEERLAHARTELAARTDEIVQLERRATRHDRVLRVALREHARLGGEQGVLQSERDRARDEVNRLSAELDRLSAELEERSQAAEQAGARAQDLGAQVEALQEEISSLRSDLAAREAQIPEIRGALAVREAEVAAAWSEAGRLGEEQARLQYVVERQRQQLELQLRQLAKRERRLPRRLRVRTATQYGAWLLRGGPDGKEWIRAYRELRRSGAFDPVFYLERYPDVAVAKLDPLMHYVEHGLREGREPNAWAQLAHDVAESSGEPSPAHVPVTGAAALEPARPAVQPLPVRARGPVEPCDMSDFTVLLSRQRSGTNPIRSILSSHPDVFCFNEVFNFADRNADDPMLRDSNFFNFVERYAGADVTRLFPDNQERLLLDFLEYLRCYAGSRRIVLDVKCNTMHYITPEWVSLGEAPLLSLFAKHGLNILRITRSNYLRYLLSTDKAWYTDSYTIDAGDTSYRDTKRYVDVPYMVSTLESCAREDDLIAQALAGNERVLTWEYADIFPCAGTTSPDFIRDVAALLDVSDQFDAAPEYRKQSSLPLSETIQNYEMIEQALRGTRFEYVLGDEPAYRDGAVAPAVSGEPRAAALADLDANEPALDEPVSAGSLDPETFAHELWKSCPKWVAGGSISFDDTRFLFREALERAHGLIVEIGTASGFSTAVLAHGASARAAASGGSPDWRIVSYDIDEHIYYDRSRRVGECVRELLPESMARRISFRNPCTVLDVVSDHEPNSISFLFIDANHRHPWPALDLLATLDVLAPGATVAFHDVNLPINHPTVGTWGAKFTFDALDLEKRVADAKYEIPNLGSVTIPEDKSALREQLLQIIESHPWEVMVDPAVLASILPPGHPQRRSG